MKTKKLKYILIFSVIFVIIILFFMSNYVRCSKTADIRVMCNPETDEYVITSWIDTCADFDGKRLSRKGWIGCGDGREQIFYRLRAALNSQIEDIMLIDLSDEKKTVIYFNNNSFEEALVPLNVNMLNYVEELIERQNASHVKINY